MAKKFEIQQPLIDSAIVVGGAGLLEVLVGNIAAIDGALANLPVVMGVSTRLLVLGTVALASARAWVLK